MVNSTSSQPNQSQQKSKAEEAAFKKLLKQIFYDITNDISGPEFTKGLQRGREAVKALLEKSGSDRIEITLKGKNKPLLTIYKNGEFESSLDPVNSYFLFGAISRALEGDTRALEEIGAIDVNKVTANGQREKLLSIDPEGNINLSPEGQVNFQGGRDSMFSSNFHENVPPIPALEDMATLIHRELQNMLAEQGIHPACAAYMMKRNNPKPRTGSLHGQTVYSDVRGSFGENPDFLKKAAQSMKKPNKKDIKKLFNDAGVIEAGDSITLGDGGLYTLSINDDEGLDQYLIEQHYREAEGGEMIYSAILQENGTLDSSWSELTPNEINFLKAEVANLKESQEYDNNEWDFPKSGYDSPRNISREYLEKALKKSIENPKVDVPEGVPKEDEEAFIKKERENIKKQISGSKGYKVEDEQGRYSFTVRKTAKSTKNMETYQVIDNFDNRKSATFEVTTKNQNNKEVKLKTSNLSPESKQLFLKSQDIGPSVELPLRDTVKKIVNHLKLRNGESERIGSYGIRRIDDFEDGPIYYLEKENENGEMKTLRAYLKEGINFVEASAVYEWDNKERPSTEELGKEIINDLGNAFRISNRKLKYRQEENSRRNYIQGPVALSASQVFGDPSMQNLSSLRATSPSCATGTAIADILCEKVSWKVPEKNPVIQRTRSNIKADFESRVMQRFIDKLSTTNDLNAEKVKKEVFEEDVEKAWEAAELNSSSKTVSKDKIREDLKELYKYDPDKKSSRPILREAKQQRE